jgi:hypothetical protein
VDERPRLLAELGTQAAHRRLQVAAAVVLSEAWMRSFTEEEAATRDGRLIETYEDKEEVVMLFGRTLDGREHMAAAPLHRRTSGRIAGYGAWHELTRVRALLLDHFFRAYLKGMVGDHPLGASPTPS